MNRISTCLPIQTPPYPGFWFQCAQHRLFYIFSDYREKLETVERAACSEVNPGRVGDIADKELLVWSHAITVQFSSLLST